MDFLNMLKGISLADLKDQDDRLWPSTLRVPGEVPAGESLPVVLDVSTLGVFLVLSMSGRFTTLDDNEGAFDSGVCNLSMTVKNGSGRVYIPDPIKLDLLLTPGRVKDSNTYQAAEPSGFLQFPGRPFVTLWQGKDQITHNVFNQAGYANSFEIAYHGFWVKR